MVVDVRLLLLVKYLAHLALIVNMLSSLVSLSLSWYLSLFLGLSLPWSPPLVSKVVKDSLLRRRHNSVMREGREALQRADLHTEVRNDAIAAGGGRDMIPPPPSHPAPTRNIKASGGRRMY